MSRLLREPQTRRQFLKGMGALAALGAAGAGTGVGIWRAVSGGGGRQATRVGSARPPTLDELARHIQAGGPGRNGIPPINRPVFLQPAEATFLRDEDPVFGLVYGGEARAYPQLVLVWHEIVNDVIAGERISVTYCPLTGSVVAFRAQVHGRPLSFGTTGNLVNSNLLMFDTVTNSEWPQVLGQAIRGPLKGRRLEQIPLVWSSWGRWRAAHPQTEVLSTKTGYARAYGQDPYGSYTPPGGYYSGGGPFFPVLRTSRRFGSKEVFVGVRSGERRLAMLKSTIRERKVLPVEAGQTPLLAIWDDELETARVLVRRAHGRTLDFRNGELRDATGTRWNPTGEAVAGRLRGARLPLADFFDVMWFGWYAFFPQTQVVV